MYVAGLRMPQGIREFQTAIVFALCLPLLVVVALAAAGVQMVAQKAGLL
jgi:hypothetical protein